MILLIPCLSHRNRELCHIIHHHHLYQFISFLLWTWNLSFPQIFPTIERCYLHDCISWSLQTPDFLCSSPVSVSTFCICYFLVLLVMCGKLSWLPISFWRHNNIVVSYHIVFLVLWFGIVKIKFFESMSTVFCWSCSAAERESCHCCGLWRTETKVNIFVYIIFIIIFTCVIAHSSVKEQLWCWTLVSLVTRLICNFSVFVQLIAAGFEFCGFLFDHCHG